MFSRFQSFPSGRVGGPVLAALFLAALVYPGMPCSGEESPDAPGNMEVHERHVTLTPDQRMQTGVAGFREKIDAGGRIVQRMFTDADGKPCLDRNGVAGWKVDYNERGQQVRVANLAPDGKSLMMSREGIAVIQNTFDSRGYLVRCRFFGVDGQPCYATNGVAGWEADYDQRGFQTRNAYLDKDGKSLMIGADGVAEFRNSYDEKGRLVRKNFFGVDGKPCFALNGAAGWEVEYDEKNRPVRTSFFGIDGKSPILIREGVAGYRDSYDAAGRSTGREFFGLDGKPCLHVSGYAGWKVNYDAQGRPAGLTYFDQNGKQLK